MNDRFSSRPITLSIAAVERDTGLSKDTLRVWERRYGFPQPQRDTVGERTYPLDQVEKLRIVKRLMDAGHRPGRIVALPLEHLQQLTESTIDQQSATSPTPWAAQDLRSYIDAIRGHDVDDLRRLLAQAMARVGLARFIGDVVVPLNTLVGDAWMRGQLEVFEEHMYTESVQVVLRNAMAALADAGGRARPRVLLTTFPGEPHGLGLLMAEAIFAVEGCRCISLGVQTPVWDIVLAARAYRSQIVALGFTSCVGPNQVIDGLTELRTKLAPTVSVWAGGAAPVLHRRAIDGVHPMASIDHLPEAIARWRREHPDAPAD